MRSQVEKKIKVLDGIYVKTTWQIYVNWVSSTEENWSYFKK